jgi:hypothetical protein
MMPQKLPHEIIVVEVRRVVEDLLRKRSLGRIHMINSTILLNAMKKQFVAAIY